LLISCATKICGDTLEESFTNVPARVYAFPFLFFEFSCVGRNCVVNCAIVGVRFRFLDVNADASLVVVFVDS